MCSCARPAATATGDRTVCTARLAPDPQVILNDPGRTRACNLWFRRPTPYPLGHRAIWRCKSHAAHVLYECMRGNRMCTGIVHIRIVNFHTHARCAGLADLFAFSLGATVMEVLTLWPSGLRRQTQVLVERSAWARTPQVSCAVTQGLQQLPGGGRRIGAHPAHPDYPSQRT